MSVMSERPIQKIQRGAAAIARSDLLRRGQGRGHRAGTSRANFRTRLSRGQHRTANARHRTRLDDLQTDRRRARRTHLGRKPSRDRFAILF